MKTNILSIGLFVILIGGITMTSCSEKKTEEVIEQLFAFDVSVTNNTSEDLEIFETYDDGKNWTDLGMVKANNTSLKRGFPLNNNVKVEARKTDGTVYATTNYRETKHKTLDWVIN